jgi:hypothetical protein
MGYLNIPVSAQIGIPIETEQDTSSDNSAFAVFLFIVIIVAVIWNLTHRTKKRRYFPADVKREVLKDQNYKCAICKRKQEYGTMTISTVTDLTMTYLIVKHYVQIVMLKRQGDYWSRRSRQSVGL